MRKMAIALAAAAVLTAGSTMTALAHGGGRGGGGGHGGGFGGGHMGGHMGGGHGGGFGSGHMGGGFGHAAFVHSGGWGHHQFHGDHFAFRHHHHFRHGFIGVGYAYDDSCRVWTRWGWRWVCGDY
jgi:hypothetical protein